MEKSSPIILVVDDDINVLRLISIMLSKSKFQIHCVSSADSALKWLNDNKPDVILMDINLPGKDGFGILEDIRSKYDYNLMKIVAFTSIALKEEKERFLKAGFHGYFIKPFNKEELISFLEVLCSK